MKLLNPGSASSSSAALVSLVSLILTQLILVGPFCTVRADSNGSIFRGVDDVINKEEEFLAGAASRTAAAGGSGDVRALKAAVVNLEVEVLDYRRGVDDVINIGFETQEKEFLADAASMIAAAGFGDVQALKAADFLEEEVRDFETDDFFICDEVAMSIARIRRDDDSGTLGGSASAAYEEIGFSCVVDPVQSTSGHTKGTHLEVMNLPPGFGQDRMDAIAKNTTRLIIRGAIVEGSVLTVPAQEEYLSDGVRSLKPVLEWQLPPPEKASRTRHSRRLATAQFGTKSVVIFRITVEQRAPPTTTAVEISDSVFGNAGDAVNLRSQYKACSFDKIDFVWADGETASGTDIESLYSAPGVIDFTVPAANLTTFNTQDIANKVAEFVQMDSTENALGLGLDLEDYDHIIYVLPPSTIYSGSTGWIAFAYKPGIDSYFNDKQITVALNQLHEIGHNMDLHHSGDAGATGNSYDYGDTTCIMGFGDGKDDTNKCFNGAKMAEIGWYDHIVSFNPVLDGDFDGKLIGVADYANVADEHALVVEVINPISSNQNIFIAFNRKKGINSGTGEMPDMVTIVRASFSKESRLFGALDENDGTNSLTVEDFFNGRDLYIFVDNKGTDAGDVDYVSVRVELQVEDCSSISDCSVGANNCVTATCNVNNKCEYSTVAGCCGNGICEANAGENCATCDFDCKKPNDCNDLSYFDLERKCSKVMTIGGTWEPAGHMFDITAEKDVAIFAFEILFNGKLFGGEKLDFVHPEVYSKKGTWVGSQFEPDAWTQYHGDSALPVVFPVTTGCPGPIYEDVMLDRPLYVKAGETVAIYITLQEPAQMFMRPAVNFVRSEWEAVGDVFIANDDLQIKAGVATEYPFGLFREVFGWPAYFIGRPKYSYGTSCYSDNQCDDDNTNTEDTCSSLSNQCLNDVGTNINICGNGLCEAAAGEDCMSCAQDCKLPHDCNILGLGVNEFGKGWMNGAYNYKFNNTVHGNMFDVVAEQDITINAFEIYTFRDDYQNTELVEIWTRKGSYEGAELREEMWLKVMNATVYKFEMERIVLQLNHPLRMHKNEKRAFYIAIEDGWTLIFGEGSVAGNVFLEDDNLQILEGVAHDGPVFSQVSVSPAKFYGSVRYTNGHDCYNNGDCNDGNPFTVDSCSLGVGGNAGRCLNLAVLNRCGNRICENVETWLNCPSDCPEPNSNRATIGRWRDDESWNGLPYYGTDGQMFDLEAKSDVSVFGIDIPRTSDSPIVVEVYVTTGSFVGKEHDPAKWTRVAKKEITLSKSGRMMVLDTPFSISANSTKGVYVTFTGDWKLVTLVDATAIGTVVAESNELKLLEGTRNVFPFGTANGPHIFFGRVKYFEGFLPCSSSLECDDNNEGTGDFCVNSECQNIPILGICGNGICEDGEYCSTCPQDCGAPDSCNILDGKVISNSISTSSAAYGSVFEIEAIKDLTFYELRAIVYGSSGVTVTLYTKLGSWSSSSGVSGWDTVFSGLLVPECSGSCELVLPLLSTPPLRTPAGSRRTFYIALGAYFRQPIYGAGDLLEGDTVVENADMKMFVGRTVKQDIGTTANGNTRFSGFFHYDYGLVKWACTLDGDCDDSNAATADTCRQGICKNSQIPDVCGNAICETWSGETCSTCPADCSAPVYCGEIDQDSGGSGSSSSSSVYGVVFDTEAIKDIAVYELEAVVRDNNPVDAKVYTKEGTYGGYTNLDDWTLVADLTGLTAVNNKLTIPFNAATRIIAGNKRSFYVAYSKSFFIVWYGVSAGQTGVNADIIVYAGGLLGNSFGSPNSVSKFKGAIRYDITEVEAPSTKPTMSPRPTFIDTPTSSPTGYPTPAPSFAIGDSPFKFKMTIDGEEKWKGCDWIAKKPETRCSGSISSHCPGSCGERIACLDSKSVFTLDAQKTYVMTCDNLETQLESPCLLNGINDTCRKKCIKDIEPVPFFLKIRNNGGVARKTCNWLRMQDAAKISEVCSTASDAGFLAASEVCVETCATTCDSLPTAAVTSSPSSGPTETPRDQCRQEIDDSEFFLKIKNGEVLTKSCSWLRLQERKGQENPSKLGKVVDLCNSNSKNGNLGPAGVVCMETCEYYKYFFKSINNFDIDINKTCAWLADPKRDEKRDTICNSAPAESATTGYKSAGETCFEACKSCPPS